MEETAKESIIKTVQEQPNDSTYEEILRELAFHQMIREGMEDSRQGRTISHEELGKEIKSWGK